MTEQPDTAEIRAMIGAASHCSTTLARELCDALDAARAREERCTTEHAPRRLAVDLKARAEAAEAREVANWREVEAMRTRVAEVESDITIIDDLASIDRARIRAALSLCDQMRGQTCPGCDWSPDIRRALTEGAGP